jgi:uncharacterized protein (DUF1499 family)
VALAVLVCLADAGFLLSRWQTPQSVPVMHDISTDLQDPPAVVVKEATRLVREHGWQLVTSDGARGVVEATASVSWIRFQDDVVLRVRPGATAQASRVDMRSRSRIGASDLGTNARRIREFLQALQQQGAT